MLPKLFPKRMKTIFTMCFTFLLVLFYQNCGLSPSIQFRSQSTSLKSVSGNGEGYEGKIRGRYVRVVPDHSCDRGGETFGEIVVKADGNIQLTKAKGKESCEKDQKQLRLVDLSFAEYNPLVIGYKEGVYIQKDKAPQPGVKDQWLLDSWCRVSSEIYRGVHTLTFYNPAKKLAKSRIHMASKLPGGEMQVETIPDFPVQREVPNRTVNYSSENFQLKVDLSKDAETAPGEFNGQLRATINNNELVATVHCRTAGSLDGETFDLSFTGASHPNSPLADRVFDETDSPAWLLTGRCDPRLGDVTIDGEDISNSHLTPCRQDGTFSQEIGYNSGEVFFTGAEPRGSKNVTIEQFPAAPQTTTVFRTTSASTLQIISTAAQLQALPTGDTGLFILANDIDISEELGVAYNWIPVGSDSLGIGNPFRGTFEGNGFTIRNLNINRSQPNQGLFGYVGMSGSIKNLALENVSVSAPGESNVGSIIGYLRQGQLSQVRVRNAAVSGDWAVGALVGYNWNGEISDCSSGGVVQGRIQAGGLVGRVWAGPIERSFSTVHVRVQDTHGGGLVGIYIAGSTGEDAIRDSYAWGSVEGLSHVGGLVGGLETGVVVERSYSSVQVRSTSLAEAGPIYGVLTNSTFATPLPDEQSLYWLNSPGLCEGCDTFPGSGLDIDKMLMPQSFKNWDMNSTWTMIKELTSPQLR